jgi:hypothetical protein
MVSARQSADSPVWFRISTFLASRADGFQIGQLSRHSLFCLASQLIESDPLADTALNGQIEPLEFFAAARGGPCAEISRYLSCMPAQPLNTLWQ